MILRAKSVLITSRFFAVLGCLVALLCLSFSFPWLLFPAKLCVSGFFVCLVFEGVLLFTTTTSLHANRQISHVLSLGDENPVGLRIGHLASRSLNGYVVEELPPQLHWRNFKIPLTLNPAEQKELTYTITPKLRGQYFFGNTLVFVNGWLGLLQRKFSFETAQEVAVYPSLNQVNRFQLHTNTVSQEAGIRKMRRVGHNYEFDQLKNYVVGDDLRSLNWKATGKRNMLMVNHYDDERQQAIYCLLDLGRAMNATFLGMSNLDYAINSTLVLSHTALQKNDKAGLVTFSKGIHTYLKANSIPRQRHLIFEHLYAEKEQTSDANFEALFQFVRQNIRLRSTLFLFSNFETADSLNRALPIFRMLQKTHLLVIVFFEDPELKQLMQKKGRTMAAIAEITISEKLMFEKRKLVGILRQHGIQSVLTSPENLTIQVLNKYLELKARGLT